MTRSRFMWLAVLGCLVLTGCNSTQRVAHIKAENALGPYSDAVISGDYCFLSGQLGTSRNGSFEEEAESAINAVENKLRTAGLALSDVVSATVFLTDINYYSYFNAVYSRRFKAPYPARACIAVKALPGKARVEVQVIAKRR